MMQKKKILHLITGLGTGGTETSLLQLLPKMQDDFDNQVCCIIGKGVTGEKLEARGIPVHYLFLRHPLDIGSIFRFKKIIATIRPDTLVTYLIHADLFGRVFGKLFGIQKVLCSERGSLLQWEFLRFFDRLTSSLVDGYVVQTAAAKQELMKKLHAPENKFHIIPNAIDISEYDFKLDVDAKKNSLGIKQGNTVILCVSNLRRGKGHKYLLAAFEKIYEKNRAINLLIAGNGEKMKSLKDQITTYASKENIFFLGNRNDIKELLKISDIFVLPTLAEGMSNAIMEAMVARIPIITTNIPANKALLENPSCGILVQTGSSEALAHAISNTIKNPSDVQKLAENATSEIHRKYDLRSVKKHWVILISQL